VPLSSPQITLSMTGILTAALDLQDAQSRFAVGRAITWTSGTAAGQVDKVWTDSRQIAASTTEDIDLAGALVDAFGAAFTPAKIKALVVVASPLNTNNVVVGGDAAAWQGPFGAINDTIHVRPGGIFAVACTDATAWPVTATTADILQVANSGAGSVVNYDIGILATSA
jgi:hypothetical protein